MTEGDGSKITLVKGNEFKKEKEDPVFMFVTNFGKVIGRLVFDNDLPAANERVLLEQAILCTEAMTQQGQILMGVNLGEITLQEKPLAKIKLTRESPYWLNWQETWGSVKGTVVIPK